jgi:hypothetical protein
MSRVVSTRAGLAVVLLLLMATAVAVLQRPVVGREAAEPGGAVSGLESEELLALLSAAASQDDSSADAAWGELLAAGFSESEILEGTGLVDPDLELRRELVARLAESPWPRHRELLQAATLDPDADVRLAAKRGLAWQTTGDAAATEGKTEAAAVRIRLVQSDASELPPPALAVPPVPREADSGESLPGESLPGDVFTPSPTGAEAGLGSEGSLSGPDVGEGERNEGDAINDEAPRPFVLSEPGEANGPFSDGDVALYEMIPMLSYAPQAPLGYTGGTSVLAREGQTSSHFVPMEDRWRSGFPEWDRYGKGHPAVDDYPYMEGNWWDPYNQNVLKGDYPIRGQHTFLNVTGSVTSVFEPRSVPVATTPSESTADPFSPEFFGDPRQFFTTNYFRLQADLTHGNSAFKPADWQLRIAPVFNMNYLKTQELGIVNPDVRKGQDRFANYMAVEEWWAEMKLADLSPDYDFVSIRGGSQPFTSDFRGFIFSDVNRGVRLFGNTDANRNQFNLAFFDQTEKDTNSQLNTFDDREQNTLIANAYRQDFLVPGYTASTSFHYNRDQETLKYDKNGFLARPAAAGTAQPHQVDAYYMGLAGDGHFGRYNISQAYYWVVGHDSRNPFANRAQRINAHMAACELSYDRDWIRFRSSVFYSTGDDDISDGTAQGFDTIFDNPVFAGGQFSYWQRQQVPLFGVSLVNRNSLVPNLRTSKFQGQSNFVNPGLALVNGGFDMDLTPKTRLIQNTSFLWFDHTETLEQFLFQSGISREIGTDVSLGIEYRPFLNNNVMITGGVAALVPAAGLKDIYSISNQELGTLWSNFVEVVLLY